MSVKKRFVRWRRKIFVVFRDCKLDLNRLWIFDRDESVVEQSCRHYRAFKVHLRYDYKICNTVLLKVGYRFQKFWFYRNVCLLEN